MIIINNFRFLYFTLIFHVFFQNKMYGMKQRDGQFVILQIHRPFAYSYKSF